MFLQWRNEVASDSAFRPALHTVANTPLVFFERARRFREERQTTVTLFATAISQADQAADTDY